MNVWRSGIIILLGVVVLMTSRGVVAQQVEQTGAYVLQTTNWSDTVTVNKFDGTLGDLIAVELGLEGEVNASAGYENLAAVPNDITLKAAAEISGSFPSTNISTLGFQLVIAPNNIGTFWSVPSFDGTNDFGGTSGQMLYGLSGSASDTLMVETFHPLVQAVLYAEFTDADGSEGGLDTISMDIEASGASMATDVHGNAASLFRTSAEGSFSLLYRYQSLATTGAVPEPTSLWMGLLGLAIVAFYRPHRWATTA